MGGAPGNHPPPEAIFHQHNGWFWPHNDSTVCTSTSLCSVCTCTLADTKLSRPDGQLCWHNASLVAHLIEKTQFFLRMPANENATIISISQNDNGLMCRDPAEMAIINAEKSPMGPLLRAINAVADAIVDEFPHVAVDTLACKCSLSLCVFFRSLKEVASRALLSVPCAPDLST